MRYISLRISVVEFMMQPSKLILTLESTIDTTYALPSTRLLFPSASGLHISASILLPHTDIIMMQTRVMSAPVTAHLLHPAPLAPPTIPAARPRAVQARAAELDAVAEQKQELSAMLNK